MIQIVLWKSRQTVVCNTCETGVRLYSKNNGTHKPEFIFKASKEARTNDVGFYRCSDRTNTMNSVCWNCTISLWLQTSSDYCHSFVTGVFVAWERFYSFLFLPFSFFFLPTLSPSLPSFLPLPSFLSCLWYMLVSVEARADQVYACVTFHWPPSELIILSKLAGQPAFEVHRSRSPMPAFTWVLRIRTQALMPAEQALLPTETFPQPQETFLSWFGSCWLYGWMKRLKANDLNTYDLCIVMILKFLFHPEHNDKLYSLTSYLHWSFQSKP